MIFLVAVKWNVKAVTSDSDGTSKLLMEIAIFGVMVFATGSVGHILLR
jgi:hypothetical protein